MLKKDNISLLEAILIGSRERLEFAGTNVACGIYTTLQGNTQIVTIERKEDAHKTIIAIETDNGFMSCKVMDQSTRELVDVDINEFISSFKSLMMNRAMFVKNRLACAL